MSKKIPNYLQNSTRDGAALWKNVIKCFQNRPTFKNNA